jgi:predicted ATPase
MTQQEALDILKMGHSVFLTGEAGAGKTHVLNQYIDWLRDHGIEPAVTASTGIAATHLGGGTIHSWSGIGIRDSIDEYELDRMEQKKALHAVKKFFGYVRCGTSQDAASERSVWRHANCVFWRFFSAAARSFQRISI